MHEVTASEGLCPEVNPGRSFLCFLGRGGRVGAIDSFSYRSLLSGEGFAIVMACLCGLLGGIYVRYVVVNGAVRPR